MFHNRAPYSSTGLILIILFAVSCNLYASAPTPIPTPTIPPLLEPTSQPTPAPPTSTPQEVPTQSEEVTLPLGDYEPLDQTNCTALMNGLTQNTNIQATITLAPFEDWFLEKTGSGCMITIAGTGEIIQDWGDVSNSISQYLLNQGWSEDLSYSAGGAGGYIQGYRNTDNLCILTVESKPINKDLCSEDEPIAVCWEGLTPDQKYYSATLNCAQDTTLYIDPEPVRIYFDTGAISDNLQGALAPSGGSRYVLMAMEGQEMSVDLQTDWPEQSGILIIWGVDGTVLLTDHGGASSFQGILPSTQDYYINIRSVSPYSFRYTLTVTIPPKQ